MECVGTKGHRRDRLQAAARKRHGPPSSLTYRDEANVVRVQQICIFDIESNRYIDI